MTDPDTPNVPPGVQAVIIDLDNAREVTPPDPDPVDPQQDAPGGDAGDPRAGATLPKGCPVTALGIKDDVAYYLDANRQLRALRFRDHSRLGIQGLFARDLDFIFGPDGWPRKKQDKDTGAWTVDGWHPERAAEDLMQAAALKGVWNALDRARGAGAWRGEGDELILHCGDEIWIGPRPETPGDGRWHKPGAIGRLVFPAAAETMRPHPLPGQVGGEGPAYALLEILQTWNWKRGDLDAVLLLGWIGAAFLGGALDWRPVAWITGGQGTGKSTLHRLFKLVFNECLVSVSDASAAGIWQKIEHSTLPIAFDELEAEADDRQAQRVIKLARQAASGGLVLRGGADHQAAEFTARSCFLFSSILIPSLLGQDRSRMAVLELDPFDAGAVPPTLRSLHIRELGQSLLRILVDFWPDFDRVLQSYRHALQLRKHDARAADVFGTLLACAHVLLHGAEVDPVEVEAWCDKLEASHSLERGDTMTDQEACLARLKTHQVDPYRNGARTLLGHWIDLAAGRGQGDAVEANKILQLYGVKVEKTRVGEYQWRTWLAIANYHSGLETIFKGTHWGQRSGTMGVWVQAVRRLEGAERSRQAIYFAGQGSIRCTLVPIEIAAPEHPTQHDMLANGEDEAPA